MEKLYQDKVKDLVQQTKSKDTDIQRLQQEAEANLVTLREEIDRLETECDEYRNDCEHERTMRLEEEGKLEELIEQ